MESKARLVLVLVVVTAAAFCAVLTLGPPATDGPARAADPEENACVACHAGVSSGIVEQWRASAHAKEGVACDGCHGTSHTTADDTEKAVMPTAKRCRLCHKAQVEQFEAGKHAKAWASASAIPMIARQPEALAGKGCYSCHSIGKVQPDGSVGKCDSCHTRHLFSKAEAQRPEACETCHMGEDHSQYEMWRSSKHGVIHHLQPESGRAPVCQTCHMDLGNHAVKTGWGFLALRLPLPDEAWSKAQMTVIRALGPWGQDEAGMKARVGAVQALDLARLTEEEFQSQRKGMLVVCSHCHSERFANEHLADADRVIRETTLLLAEAIDVVQGLYDDGILPREKDDPKHVDLLEFYDSRTPIEQELYQMFLFHRQKAFQGAIHVNPDYTHWYGWAPMKTSLVRIKAMAADLRNR